MSVAGCQGWEARPTAAVLYPTKRNLPMRLDPATVCVRSFAGDAEAERARHGLSLTQRRLLVLLDRPRSVAGFAALARFEPARFERELIVLRKLGLVALLTPACAAALAHATGPAEAAEAPR